MTQKLGEIQTIGKAETKKYQSSFHYNYGTNFYSNDLYSIVQFVLRCLSRFVMQFFANIEVLGKQNANTTSKPVIVVANHKSYFDPLLVAHSLPLFSSIYPLRFIAKDQLFQGSVSRFFYKIMGCFPAFYGTGIEKSLELPAELLKKNAAVVFFPEGKCIREENLGEAKPGVGVLTLKVPHVQILPIAIHGSYKMGKFLSRPKVKIMVGQPISISEKIDQTSTPESISELIMNEISNLYQKI